MKIQGLILIASIIGLEGIGGSGYVYAQSKGQIKLERDHTGISAKLSDQGDYYLHPNGQKIKFYRKQDVFALEMKTGQSAKSKGVDTLSRFAAQFRGRVSTIKNHRLGSTNVSALIINAKKELRQKVASIFSRRCLRLLTREFAQYSQCWPMKKVTAIFL